MNFLWNFIKFTTFAGSSSYKYILSLIRNDYLFLFLIAFLITFLFFIKTESPQTLDFTALIGATGFEPATSRPPAVRATKLRHTPRTFDIVPNVVKKINYFFGKPIFLQNPEEEREASSVSKASRLNF